MILLFYLHCLETMTKSLAYHGPQQSLFVPLKGKREGLGTPSVPRAMLCVYTVCIVT